MQCSDTRPARYTIFAPALPTSSHTSATRRERPRYAHYLSLITHCLSHLHHPPPPPPPPTSYLERDTSYNYREAPWVVTVAGNGDVVEKKTLLGNTGGAIQGGGSEGGFRSLVPDNCDSNRIAMRITHESAAEARVAHLPSQLCSYDWEDDAAAIVAKHESQGLPPVPGRETTFTEYLPQVHASRW